MDEPVFSGTGVNTIFEQALRYQIKGGNAALLTPGAECDLGIKNTY